MTRPNVQEVIISNMIYHVGYFTDGHEWSTGPCESQTIASQRLELYRRGEPVSEAAPQQASRRQLEAISEWFTQDPNASARIGITSDTVKAALENGILSEEWIWASLLFVSKFRELPERVARAGGSRVMRGPEGPILVEAIGRPSLARNI